MKVYQALAQATWGEFNERWTIIMEEKIETIMKGAPSCPVIDGRIQFLPEKSNKEKLVFSTACLHLNDMGYYDSRTKHRVIVSHDMVGPNIRVTGENRDGIKEYLSSIYYHWLTRDVDWFTGEYIK